MVFKIFHYIEIGRNIIEMPPRGELGRIVLVAYNVCSVETIIRSLVNNKSICIYQKTTENLASQKALSNLEDGEMKCVVA